MKLSLFSLVFILLLSCNSYQQQLDSVISTAKKEHQLHGVIAILDSNEVVFKDSIGFANKCIEIVNNFDSKYQIASITKIFTQFLILQLYEQGKLSLDDTVSKYLPEFDSDIGKIISIRQLLSMQSGLPRELEGYKGVTLDSNYRSLQFINSLNLDLLIEPGTKYSYSNVGYWVLGAIIESVTNSDLKTALSNQITAKLKMKNTGFGQRTENDKNFAIGYSELYNEAETVYVDSRFTSGGMYSSMNDLIIFFKSLLQNKLLSEKNTELLFTSFEEISSTDEIKVYNLSAFLPGFPHHISVDYGQKQVLIILNNLEVNPLENVSKLSKECLAIYNGKSFHNLKSETPLGIIKVITPGLPDNALGETANRFIDALNAKSQKRIEELYEEIIDFEELDSETKRSEAIKTRMDMMAAVDEWQVIGYEDWGNLGINVLVESKKVESSATMRFVHSKTDSNKYRSPDTDWNPKEKFDYLSCLTLIDNDFGNTDDSALLKSARKLSDAYKGTDPENTKEVLKSLFVPNLKSNSSFNNMSKDVIKNIEEYIGNYQPKYYAQLSDSELVIIAYGVKEKMELQLIIESSVNDPSQLMRITSIFKQKNYNIIKCE